MKTALIIIALLLFPCLSFAYTGNDLLDDCDQMVKSIQGIELTTNQASGMGHCLGYIQAVMNESFLLPNVCIPQETTVGDGFNIVIKFLRDHPKDLHHDAVNLVNAAFVHAFPCKGK